MLLWFFKKTTKKNPGCCCLKESGTEHRHLPLKQAPPVALQCNWIVHKQPIMWEIQSLPVFSEFLWLLGRRTLWGSAVSLMKINHDYFVQKETVVSKPQLMCLALCYCYCGHHVIVLDNTTECEKTLKKKIMKNYEENERNLSSPCMPKLKISRCLSWKYRMNVIPFHEGCQ